MMKTIFGEVGIDSNFTPMSGLMWNQVIVYVFQ